MNYYNEVDPKAAAWLRELIKNKLIPDGIVDTRSITEVQPDDLKHYTQCHFFAGIGGWSLALRLANWPEDRPVWTGSCPCQPFSTAGKQMGRADPRHLWPAFRCLINKCRPPVVFGEQVASAAGREWLSGVRSNLETMGYAVGAADLCAAGVGAPHIRQRLYWVADSRHERRRGWAESVGTKIPEAPDGCRVGLPNTAGLQRDNADRELPRRVQHDVARYGFVGDSPGDDIASDGREQQRTEPDGRGFVRGGRMGNADGSTQERLGSVGVPLESEQEAGRPGSPNAWSRYAFVECADGKARRIEPAFFPLAHGVPARVVRLRGYGNAIVPPLAAEFIGACLGIGGGSPVVSDDLL